MDGDHACAAPGCRTLARPQQLMCLKHWLKVPRDIQTEVNATWRRVRREPAVYREARDKAIAAVSTDDARQGSML